MIRPLLAVLAVLLGDALAAAQAPTHRIVATNHQTVNATITYEVYATRFAVTRWMVFLPVPPELPSQTRVKATTEPVGKLAADRSPLARPVRFIDVPVPDPTPGARLRLRLEIEATLRSRKLVPLEPGEVPPAVPALTAAEAKFYLAADKRADYEAKPFRDWLDARKLRLAKGGSSIDLAGRILAVLRSDFEYGYDPAADRRASVVCGRKVADCGGMSYLFIATMRANGIPARLLVGRTAQPPKPGTSPGDLDFDRPHARPEFHVPGLGWVPADPTYANTNTGKPVGDFVGTDPGDLLVLHVEADLRLPYPDQVRTGELLQLGPGLWVHGKGKFDVAAAPRGVGTEGDADQIEVTRTPPTEALVDVQLIDLYHRHVGTAHDRQLRLADLVQKKAPGENWVYDTAVGTLAFGKLRFDAPFVGGHVENNNSWLWAWSNKNLKLSLTNRALGDTVRSLVHRLGMHALGAAGIALEPLLGSEFTPVAAHILGVILSRELDYDAFFTLPHEGGRGLCLIRDDRLKGAEKRPLARVAAVFPVCLQEMPVADHKVALAAYARDHGLTVTEEPRHLKIAGAGKAELPATFDDRGRLTDLGGVAIPPEPLPVPVPVPVPKPAKKPAARAAKKPAAKAAKKLAAKKKPGKKKRVD